MTGSDIFGMAQPLTSSPLVKRRSHVRSSIQKRVSFHQDQVRRPEELAYNLSHATSQNHLVGCCYALDDRISNRYPVAGPTIRRYHSDIAINQSANNNSFAKYPTIAERGVPEGQEDPETLKADNEHRAETATLFLPKHLILRRSAQLKQTNAISTTEKRRYLEWAKNKWHHFELVPELPLPLQENSSACNDDNDLIVSEVSRLTEPLLPVEIDPNERFKVFCIVYFLFSSC